MAVGPRNRGWYVVSNRQYIQRIDASAVLTGRVSQESENARVNRDIKSEITEYAESHNLSNSEATQALLHAGLSTRREESLSASAETSTRAQLEQQQEQIVDQQQKIIRFQKFTVFAGIGWAVLTIATGETGPLWTALGMLTIVLMASSTYVWQYLPPFGYGSKK